MNLAVSIAVYASICKELGLPLRWAARLKDYACCVAAQLQLAAVFCRPPRSEGMVKHKTALEFAAMQAAVDAAHANLPPHTCCITHNCPFTTSQPAGFQAQTPPGTGWWT